MDTTLIIDPHSQRLLFQNNLYNPPHFSFKSLPHSNFLAYVHSKPHCMHSHCNVYSQQINKFVYSQLNLLIFQIKLCSHFIGKERTNTQVIRYPCSILLFLVSMSFYIKTLSAQEFGISGTVSRHGSRSASHQWDPESSLGIVVTWRTRVLFQLDPRAQTSLKKWN